MGAAAALYFAVAAACIALTRFGAQVAPIWLASPVLVFALLTIPEKSWPVMLAFGAAAHALANAVNQEPIAFAAPYLVANICEALLAAALLRRTKVDLDFSDRAEVFRFLAICGVAAPALSAVLAKIGVTLTGETITDRDLFMWYLAIALGLLLFLPLLKGFKTHSWSRLLKAPSRVRAIMLFGALSAVCAVAMVWPGNFLLLLLVLPILILIAFDFGLAGAESGLALTALLLVAGVLLGFRPDFGAEGPREDISRLQIMIALLAAGILPLAALVEEKQRLYESASRATEEAQQAWGDIIAAEANYRLLADSTRSFVLRINTEGLIDSASAASPLLGYDQQDMEGSYLSTYLDEASAATLGHALVTTDPSAENNVSTLRLRIRGRDNSWRMFEAVMRPAPPSGAGHKDLILILSPVD
jgi:integral membrane sensor domain MASE1